MPRDAKGSGRGCGVPARRLIGGFGPHSEAAGASEGARSPLCLPELPRVSCAVRRGACEKPRRNADECKEEPKGVKVLVASPKLIDAPRFSPGRDIGNVAPEWDNWPQSTRHCQLAAVNSRRGIIYQFND